MADNTKTREVIKQVAHLITNKDEYNEAAKLMISNNITIKQLSEFTLKLSVYRIAKLTDKIIALKKGK